MDINLHQRNAFEAETPLLALGVFEDEPLPDSAAALIEADDFKGAWQQHIITHPRDSLPSQRLMLLGLGKQATATADNVRQFAAQAARKAHELRLASFSINLPIIANLSAGLVAQALAEGAELGLYQYLAYKSELTDEQKHRVERLDVMIHDDGDVHIVQQGVALGQATANGVKLARDLANGPGNAVTPAHLGKTAQDLGAQFGFRVTVLDRDALEEQGFGGILAVGQGSAQQPRFIVMEHGSAAEDRPTICLVGKGITFDTGGISIKPAERMDDMKMDMGGAAAVFGAMHIVGALQLPLHIIGLVASAENMPSAAAYKPGDIITTLSGKTVEVLNTDAEGRIVLADALTYAQRYQPRAIVDLATLTGAIMVALGPHAIGMMGNNQELIDRLAAAGEAASERVWQLPLWDDYRDMIKSDIADLKNVGGRYGGAITAASFLSAFAGDYPWVHLDIAGTAWTDAPRRSDQIKGATGVGVRLLAQMLQTFVNNRNQS